MAALDFVVHAATEPFDLAFDNVETAIHFREVLVDCGELSCAGIGERLDEAIDVREAFFHARSQLSKALLSFYEALIDLDKALLGASEALVHLLFEAVEAVVEIGFLHMREVYHSAPAAHARFVTEWAQARRTCKRGWRSIVFAAVSGDFWGEF
jgi:hypothetical protein